MELVISNTERPFSLSFVHNLIVTNYNEVALNLKPIIYNSNNGLGLWLNYYPITFFYYHQLSRIL